MGDAAPCRDAPTGFGGAGEAAARAALADDGQTAHDAALARRQHQPARCGEVVQARSAREDGDGRAKRAAAQALLQRPERLHWLAHAHDQQAVGVETEAGQAMAVGLAGLAPARLLQDQQQGPGRVAPMAGTAGAQRKGERESEGRGPVASLVRRDLMQGRAPEDGICKAGAQREGPGGSGRGELRSSLPMRRLGAGILPGRAFQPRGLPAGGLDAGNRAPKGLEPLPA